ncbi:radical sam protein : Radical SAM OS=Planctomyces maris DSM 8797 GN=PM8797T_09934 PE=4 SV=1: Radical_SAM [Gemmata massiliana]|uniref:Radical SAM core domain-containing protein n=1 Tax=Gemmata massiliana TaxID=1210884 RepID=A0A6P2D4C5_9BACT|nr:PA0069 family radical SAM protein [Gemmata massiliana]VTR95336.1 radical sam protein : Radical SAM OS=Planctomyces maris DSM 8797 GN=PM8797T_09934 PE=4 SV=1: Radical_SAM [Gemmata massiliana]
MIDARIGLIGRGSNLQPVSRFDSTSKVLALDVIDLDADDIATLSNPATEFIPDRTKSVISENDSPDVGFRYSLNPYRGCEHGCSYCYARPTHEYLGFDAGLGFETKIVVKHDAPKLFRAFLARDAWVPEPIALSGVTDPYQPCERRFRLTRRCLEVAAVSNQPMSIITKNALVVRDLDLLAPMATEGLVHVNVSIGTLNAALARSMEPRASTPLARLRAVRELSAAGLPVRVLVAPIIPGLNDAEIPTILEAVKEAGASAAAYTMLRLPWAVAPVFMDWMARTFPERVERVEGRVRDARGGRLNNSAFDQRMTGTGVYAELIRRVFRVFARRFGLNGGLPPYDCSKFQPPPDANGQGRLF